jgi:hypothetical protein
MKQMFTSETLQGLVEVACDWAGKVQSFCFRGQCVPEEIADRLAAELKMVRAREIWRDRLAAPVTGRRFVPVEGSMRGSSEARLAKKARHEKNLLERKLRQAAARSKNKKGK